MDKTRADVVFVFVNSPNRGFNDRTVIAREIVTEILHPVKGPIKMVGSPVRYDNSQGKVRLPARLGNHHHEILGRSGLPAGAVAKLKQIALFVRRKGLTFDASKILKRL